MHFRIKYLKSSFGWKFLGFDWGFLHFAVFDWDFLGLGVLTRKNLDFGVFEGRLGTF